VTVIGRVTVLVEVAAAPVTVTGRVTVFVGPGTVTGTDSAFVIVRVGPAVVTGRIIVSVRGIVFVSACVTTFVLPGFCTTTVLPSVSVTGCTVPGSRTVTSWESVCV
jgi:hypothetical protein